MQSFSKNNNFIYSISRHVLVIKYLWLFWPGAEQNAAPEQVMFKITDQNVSKHCLLTNQLLTSIYSHTDSMHCLAWLCYRYFYVCCRWCKEVTLIIAEGQLLSWSVLLCSRKNKAKIVRHYNSIHLNNTFTEWNTQMYLKSDLLVP